MIETLASALLSLVLLWFVLALLSTAIHPYLRSRLFALDPAQASNYLLAFLALPLLCATAAALLLYLPSISGALVDAHCHAGDCRGHGPVLEHAVLPAAVLLFWYGARAAYTFLRNWWQGVRLARELSTSGVLRGGMVELDAVQPVAFTLGWWKPTIFLSRGLLEQCSEQDVSCILAHERGHRRRRDNLRLLVAQLLLAALPSRLARGQLGDLKLLHELAADRGAAGDCGAEAVAASLLRVARLQSAPLPEGCAAFTTGNQTVVRVEKLLCVPPARLPANRSLVLLLWMLLAVVVLINPLHTLLETLTPL